MTTSEPSLLDKMLFQIGFIKTVVTILSPEDLDAYIGIVRNLLRQQPTLADIENLDALYKKFEKPNAGD